jgi:hypothetical protein
LKFEKLTQELENSSCAGESRPESGGNLRIHVQQDAVDPVVSPHLVDLGALDNELGKLAVLLRILMK